MAHAQPLKGKPWFSTPGKPGDRTLEQQLMGLEPLFAEVAGKTVLDVGCAEGLISIECAKHGARCVTGLEIRPDAVRCADKGMAALGISRPFTWWFKCGSADDPEVAQKFRSYDIVLMLAVLHKLKDPSAACRRLAAAAKDLVVIRLPPGTDSVIIDPRSGNVPNDIGWVMADEGFELERAGHSGPFGEWVGYYRRRHAQEPRR